jgi:hypothetical protein
MPFAAFACAPFNGRSRYPHTTLYICRSFRYRFPAFVVRQCAPVLVGPLSAGARIGACACAWAVSCRAETVSMRVARRLCSDTVNLRWVWLMFEEFRAVAEGLASRLHHAVAVDDMHSRRPARTAHDQDIDDHRGAVGSHAPSIAGPRLSSALLRDPYSDCAGAYLRRSGESRARKSMCSSPMRWRTLRLSVAFLRRQLVERSRTSAG